MSKSTIMTEHGYCLTLGERKIMMGIIKESERRTRETGSQLPIMDTWNLYDQIGIFTRAYLDGNIKLSEFERCE